MPSTSAMFSAMVTIEPRYLVSVGSTLLRLIAVCISETTWPMSQRPMIQNAIAARILMARSVSVVLRKVWIECMSMQRRPVWKLAARLWVRACNDYCTGTCRTPRPDGQFSRVPRPGSVRVDLAQQAQRGVGRQVQQPCDVGHVVGQRGV